MPIQNISPKDSSDNKSQEVPHWIFNVISIEVALKIICLQHPFAKYLKMSKYLMLDTERYNNKI